MTVIHLLVLVAGILVAVVLADLLGHRDIGAWPVGLLALALIPVAGYFYSAWIAAFALGVACGAVVFLVGHRIRQISRERRALREARAAKEQATDAMLRRGSSHWTL